jgi:hypothetical protein
MHQGFLLISLKIALIFFILLFRGFKKIDVTEGCGKTHKHRYNGDKNVSSVSNKLLKHGCNFLLNKGISCTLTAKGFLVKN